MPRSRRHRRTLQHPHQNRFGQHAFEPVWRPRRHLFSEDIPAAENFWLFDASSLTARILQACHDTFRVEVISQGWQRPMLNEEQCLRINYRCNALVRQVRLYCGDKPWVFARTVIPRETLTGAEKHLAHLQNKPLGAVLFANPTMRRGEVEVAQIKPGQRLFQTATADMACKPASIWGRRSVFYLHSKPLLVSEIFLPDILQVK
ncbi:MAG: chorismate lyase [Gammaproteobacteria bacterium]|nr:chorismate lyase [Gammaproteobacteria bacterium]MDH5653217.1 chorismate lyase [Gammaproteobacteria bacterium]